MKENLLASGICQDFCQLTFQQEVDRAQLKSLKIILGVRKVEPLD